MRVNVATFLVKKHAGVVGLRSRNWLLYLPSKLCWLFFFAFLFVLNSSEGDVQMQMMGNADWWCTKRQAEISCRIFDTMRLLPRKGGMFWWKEKCLVAVVGTLEVRSASSKHKAIKILPYDRYNSVEHQWRTIKSHEIELTRARWPLNLSYNRVRWQCDPGCTRTEWPVDPCRPMRFLADGAGE